MILVSQERQTGLGPETFSAGPFITDGQGVAECFNIGITKYQQHSVTDVADYYDSLAKRVIMITAKIPPRTELRQ